jgi:hypothetical protein
MLIKPAWILGVAAVLNLQVSGVSQEPPEKSKKVSGPICP